MTGADVARAFTEAGAPRERAHPLLPESWATFSELAEEASALTASELHDGLTRASLRLEEIPGATDFTDDPQLQDELFIPAEITRHEELFKILEKGTTPAEVLARRNGEGNPPHRPRREGHDILIAIAMELAQESRIERFRQQKLSSPIWEIAGFEGWVPGHSAFNARIRDLNRRIGGIYAGCRYLCERIRERVPSFGTVGVIDGVSEQSHGVLHHLCEDEQECRRKIAEEEARRRGDAQRGVRRARRGPRAPGSSESVPKFISVASARDVQAERARESALPLEELGNFEATEREIIESRRGLDGREFRQEGARKEVTRRYKAVPINGHRYLTRDLTAGFRSYDHDGQRKFWHGTTTLTSFSQCGGLISSVNIPADVPEWKAYPELLRRHKEVTGIYPLYVVADRGFFIGPVLHLNALLDVESVMPFRRVGSAIKSRKDLARPGEIDEFGVRACAYCGQDTHAEGRGLGPVRIEGRPKVRVRCSFPVTEECKRVQVFDCARDVQLCGVGSRFDPLFVHLRKIGGILESQHGHMRDRYGLHGNNPDTRPQRVGQPYLELRNAIAQFLDLFRLALRLGVLGERERTVTPQPLSSSKIEEQVDAKRLHRAEKLGLLPSGPQAEELGLVWNGRLPKGWRRKPSKETRRFMRRARGDPVRRKAA